jgi:hypothetical protein
MVVLVSTSLPYYTQWRSAPPGQQFGGLISSLSDQNTYLMWMRQAGEGHLLWRDLMTTDPHAPFYTNPLWLGLGALTRLGLSPLMVYHGARVAFMLLLLIALYALLGALLPRVAERRVALAMMATGEGLFWVFFWLNRPSGGLLPAGTAAFGAPELLAWPSMALLPHFTAALAGMVTVFYLALAAYRREESWRRYAGLGGLVLALVASFHVYDVVTVTAVLLVHWVMAFRAGKIPPHAHRALAAILLPGWAITILVGVMLQASPLGRAWSQANQMLSWSPFTYAVGLGVPLILALLDHRKLLHWRRMDLGQILVAVWLLVNGALLFTDGLIPWERRLMMGLQIPVVVLAVRNWGQYVVPRWMGVPAGRRGGAGGMSAVLAWGILLLLVWPGLGLRIAYYGHQPNYLSDDFRQVCARLETLPRDQGVLSDAVLGNWIPQLSGQSVYLGHKELTPHFLERRDQVQTFFELTTTDRARRELLATARCRWVVAEGEEREGLASAVAEGLLLPELSLPSVTLYRVAGS